MPYVQTIRILICSILITGVTFSCKPKSTEAKTQSLDTVPKQTSAPISLRDSLPQQTGYVNDYEGLFTRIEKDSLESIIKLFEKETTIQIAVITLDSTITTATTLEQTTLQIANAWGVGEKGKNNGIAIGISKQFRKMRIQNGYGIAKILSDSETKKIVDEDFIPSFKNGQYYNGTKKGLLSLMKKLREKYTA